MSEPSGQWFLAIQRGQTGRVDEMLSVEPALASARDANGVSSVMWACYARQREVLDRLLARSPSLDVFEAVVSGQEATALAWLERDAGLARAWSPDGFTALHFAAFFGRPALAGRLLALGAEVDAVARNSTGVTPLHSAAAAASLEVVRLLLARGAHANARQALGFTPLMSAAQQGNQALCDLLLEHCADPRLRAEDGRAAADLADEKGHHALAAKLRGTDRSSA